MCIDVYKVLLNRQDKSKTKSKKCQGISNSGPGPKSGSLKIFDVSPKIFQFKKFYIHKHNQMDNKGKKNHFKNLIALNKT